MNNKTEFTPAPWVVWGNDIGVIDRSDSQSNGMMLQVAYSDMYNFGDDIGDDNATGKANAHLIAVAPEMYDLLATIENDDNQVPQWLWGKIQATLAKARGEIND